MIVNSAPPPDSEKLAQLKQAVHDPLFLADLEHFQGIPIRLKRRAGRPRSQGARPKQPLMTAPSRP